MSSDDLDPATARLQTSASSVQRLFWAPLWVAVGLVLAVLFGMLFVSWRSLDRLAPIEAHLGHIERIQNVGLSMEQTLLKGLRGSEIKRSELLALRAKIEEIAVLEGALHPDTAGRLKQIETQLGDERISSIDVLFETLAEIRRVLDGERERHDWLLTQIGRDSRMEIRLTISLLLIGPILLAISLVAVQGRVRRPLEALEDLLARLGRRDYRPVPESLIGQLDKVAHPALYSFNELVTRLQQLEAEHQNREQMLEHEVRRATEALLAQSRELGRAERLAAVGAVSAGLAHELRNPLAGIQMACSKLHRALHGSEHATRIGAVIDELKRINRLLTSQVDAARHQPEPLEMVAIDELVRNLVALLRYQVPEQLRIDVDLPRDLRCPMPAASLRQALLNLVLNAVQVISGQGRIEITAKREDGQLRIRVADSGPGFPAELLRTGIRPFATGRQGGTGLGLAMVRRFVRDHDGDLHLANQTPHGAVVTIMLPCRSSV